jgi:hypothetical protein
MGWGRFSTDKRFEKVQTNRKVAQVYKTVLLFVYSHRATAHQFKSSVTCQNLLKLRGVPQTRIQHDKKLLVIRASPPVRKKPVLGAKSAPPVASLLFFWEVL